MSTRRLRVLVVDDSPLFRDVLRELLGADGDITVVGEAGDGQRALDQVVQLAPDLVTVDILMPGLGGLAAIERIMAERPVPILVVTGQPTDAVFDAIERGALEIMEKSALAQQGGAPLRTLVRRLAGVRVVRHVAPTAVLPTAAAPPIVQPSSPAARRDLVAIAASSGGPSTLAAVLGALPSDFGSCVAIVQHLPIGFVAPFARFLQQHTRLEVSIVTGRTPARPGQVLLAPDDRHLVWTADGSFAPSSAPAIGGHRPSATALFRSLAGDAAGRSIGVVLTGMGEDGAAGLLELKSAGGLTVAQDQKSAAIYGMPKAAADAGAAGWVLGTSEIAAALLRWTRG